MSSDLQAVPAFSAAEIGSRPVILVIDGDQSQVEALCRRLEQQGFETLSASSGARGLALAREHQPQLVLMDVRLPDSDGFTLCEQLVDDPETCLIPVILVGRMGRADVVRCSRRAGSRYFVRKPYDPNALLVLIQHALEFPLDEPLP